MTLDKEHCFAILLFFIPILDQVQVETFFSIFIVILPLPLSLVQIFCSLFSQVFCLLQSGNRVERLVLTNDYTFIACICELVRTFLTIRLRESKRRLFLYLAFLLLTINPSDSLARCHRGINPHNLLKLDTAISLLLLRQHILFCYGMLPQKLLAIKGLILNKLRWIMIVKVIVIM